ncbi:MAG TPA: fatty acid desaturase [Steroidobacteraceae bacterium]|nr:fatty acid desaturase [Steroidobacteraceae bacterium]
MNPSPRAAAVPLIWSRILMFVITGAVAVTVVPWYGFAHGYSIAAWVWFVVLLYANGLAITTGYHRLWSHKTYDAHWSVRVVLMLFGTMALQNSILHWAANHRSHHQFVDDDSRDPYSAGRGLWFSHIGWMLREHPSGRADYGTVRDLQRDPIVAFQHRWYLPLALLLNIGLPLALGWLHGDLWGVFLLAGVLRLVVSHHFTFLINSVAHAFGRQPYSDEHSARDNGWLAVLTYGEGYHNFHHQFAHDYRNGIRWWHWDPSKWIICSLSWLGLTRKLRRTPAVVIQRARLDMQFRRMKASLEHRRASLPHVDLERIRATVAHEYEQFAATVAKWSKLTDAWYQKTRERLVQRWEEASFRSETRALLAELRLQHRRLKLLSAQLA